MKINDCFVPRFLEWLKQGDGSRLAFAYLDDKGDVAKRVSYRDLKNQSAALARCMLRQQGIKPGDRVLLVYPPSLDFIIAFIACLMSGVIAVPTFPPNPTKLQNELSTFRSIISSSGATVALTSGQYYSAVRMAEVKHLVTGEEAAWGQLKSWITTDAIIADAAEDASIDTFLNSLPECNEASVAFLQYTSGSTSDPKGVMISHGNLAHNLSLIITGLQAVEDTVVVSWLPQYHDMGLIGSYLGAVYCGGCGYYLSPFHFIKNPVLWVQCMAKYRGTHIQAPNFAYTLTARKFLAKKSSLALSDFDLSSVRHMINAAEPVEVGAIESFYAAFEQYGLRRGVIFPTYGLAEHTVYVCSNGEQRIIVDKQVMEEQQRVQLLDDSTLSKNSVSLVGCGKPSESKDVELKIVQKKTHSEGNICFEAVPEDTVGEIWIKSPSKALGYWGLPLKTKTDFGAMINCNIMNNVDMGSSIDDIEDEALLSVCDVDAGYLRTGDLGFLHNGELFVCGRMKDLVIIRGRNLYPQDIERSCENATFTYDDQSFGKPIRAGCTAAFSIPIGGEEVLVYASEVTDDFFAHTQACDQASRSRCCSALLELLRGNVRTTHGVSPSVVLLLNPRSIPKTTSGKIARRWVRTAYLKDELKRIATWNNLDGIDDDEKDAEAARLAMGADTSNVSSATIENLSIIQAGEVNKLGLPMGQLDPTILSVTDVLQELKRLVSAVIGEKDLTKIKENLPVSAVGLDSMQGIALQSAFEERFSIQIPDEVLMDSDSTLLTLAASLVGGGSFKYRPVMVQAYDVHKAVMRIEAKKPKSWSFFTGSKNSAGSMKAGGVRTEVMTPQWFLEYGVKAHVDTLKFGDGCALQPTGPKLSLWEELVCCIMGFGIFGSVFWYPVLQILILVFFSVNISIPLTIGALSFIYLVPWSCWPPGGRKDWTYGFGCRYYSYRCIIEAPVEAYAGIQSIYAFGPHGIFPIAPGFQALLNEFVVGENFHMLAASAIFWTPVFNIFAKYWGYKSVEKKVFKQLLESKRSVGLLPGGIAEMFVAGGGENGNEILVVQNRKGFISLALQAGVQIVPCYCFGNAQLYDCANSTMMESLSRSLRTSLILFWGRFGLPIPKRHPFLSVIGSPIPVPKVSSPTPELINEYHEKYLKETRRIFDRYKNTMNWKNKNLEFRR